MEDMSSTQKLMDDLMSSKRSDDDDSIGFGLPSPPPPQQADLLGGVGVEDDDPSGFGLNLNMQMAPILPSSAPPPAPLMGSPPREDQPPPPPGVAMVDPDPPVDLLMSAGSPTLGGPQSPQSPNKVNGHNPTHPFHHRHQPPLQKYKQQVEDGDDEDDDEEECKPTSPMFNGSKDNDDNQNDNNDEDDDDDDEEEEEEDQEAAEVKEVKKNTNYPVPHPRSPPHTQSGLTPLLGRRPEGGSPSPPTVASPTGNTAPVSAAFNGGGNTTNPNTTTSNSSGGHNPQEQQGGGEGGGASSGQHHQGPGEEEAERAERYSLDGHHSGTSGSGGRHRDSANHQGENEAPMAEPEVMAETASVATSGRKQSAGADSLATTATMFKTGADRASARATTMRSVSLLYTLLLVALGAVFPLAFFLSGRTREAGWCFAALHVYVTLMSILFVLYLNIAIWRWKRKDRRLLAADGSTNEDHLPQDPADGGKQNEAAETEENGYVDGGAAEASPTPKKRPLDGAPSPGGTLKSGASAMRGERLEAGYGVFRMPLVGTTEDGVNWFLRLGLIAFGMGSMVLDGFRLVLVADREISIQCIGLTFLIFTGLRLLFTFAQTFFLFKNHRVLINFSPLTVRFTLLHMAATNVIMWIMTVIMEGANNFVNYHYIGDFRIKMPPNPLLDNMTSADNYTIINGTAAVTSPPPLGLSGATDNAPNVTENPLMQWLFEDMPPMECYVKHSLAREASPYLYPCVIEYSLLAVAILCRMYTNVGRAVPIHDEANEVKDSSGDANAKKGTLECHKANSGLFIGLFLFTLVSIGMLFFLLWPQTHGTKGVNPMAEPLTALVYYGSDIGVNVFALIALAPAFAQMRKLHFSVFVREVFNENLMYVSVTGFFTLVALMVIPAIMSICATGIWGTITVLLSELQAISCVLALIQACTQVVFIFDGLRRRAATRTHFRSKPGRSLITFLLLCNVSLWVIDTFELKEAMTAELFMNFYGDFPWMLLVHIVLPLTIFFRFHSTVCLSDMWVNAYHRPRMPPARPLSPDRHNAGTPYY